MNAELKAIPWFRQPVFIIYLVLNLIGLLLYFICSTSISRLAQTEQRNYYDATDSITFISTAGPVLAVCFLINLSWVIKTFIDLVRKKGFRAFAAGALVAILWAADFGLCNLIAQAAIKNGIIHFSP